MTVTWDVGKTSLTNSEEGRVRNGTFSCSWGSSLGAGGERTLAKTPPTPCGGDRITVGKGTGGASGVSGARRYLQVNTQILLPAGWVVEAVRTGAHRGILWALTGPSNHKLNFAL